MDTLTGPEPSYRAYPRCVWWVAAHVRRALLACGRWHLSPHLGVMAGTPAAAVAGPRWQGRKIRPKSGVLKPAGQRATCRHLCRRCRVAQGLEHLHSLRVVHGDLKPGNVLLKGSRVDVRGFNAQVR